MGKGDAKVALRSFRGALRDWISKWDESSLLRVRGEVQILAPWFESRRDEARAATVRAALDAITRLYQFNVEIRGFASSRQAAEVASLFDMGSVGVLAMENVLTAERRTPMRLLMSGLSEGLMFLASRQYVKGGQEVLASTYRLHAIALQDQLWSLAADFRGAGDLATLREARAAIDSLFAKLEEPGIPVEAKVSVLQVLYSLVALLRCARVLEALEPLA